MFSPIKSAIFVIGAVLLGSTTDAEDRPNIVFILADDLGWADLSTGQTNLGNGSEFYETPHLDRLATQGVCFTNAHVQPNCAPTRAAILSGLYAPRKGNGVYNVNSLNRPSKKTTTRLIPPKQNQDIPPATVTIAESFRDAGYTTAHFGKYHVGGHEGGDRTMPQAQGFDVNIAGGQAGHPSRYFARRIDGKWKFGKHASESLASFSEPYSKAYLDRYGMPRSLEGTPKHLSDAMSDAFENFVSERSKQKKPKPFYAHFWLFSVHTPIQPSPDLKSHFDKKKKAAKGLTEHTHSKYAALIGNMDRAVGRILAALDDPNGDGDPSDSIADNTIVVFCSDNGGARQVTSNRPLRRAKGTFYEGGIRVPLIVRYPGKATAAATNDTLIHAVDFFPTFHELAGCQLPPISLDGHSFAGAVTNPEKRRHRPPVFYHFPGYLDNRAAPSSTAIGEIDGSFYKLIHFYENGKRELYNLSDDLGEENDLLADATENSEMIARKLAEKLRDWLQNPDSDWNPVYATRRDSGKKATFPGVRKLVVGRP